MLAVSLVRKSSAAAPLDPMSTPALRALLLLERTLAGADRDHLVDDIARSPDAAGLPLSSLDEVQRGGAGQTPDLVVDLRASPEFGRTSSPRTLVPTYNSHTGIASLWDMLLSGGACETGLADSTTGRIVAVARPALETPQRLLESADAILDTLIVQITLAVTAIAGARVLPEFISAADHASSASTSTGNARTTRRALQTGRRSVEFIGRRIAAKASRSIDRLLDKSPAWQVAWRKTAKRTVPGEALDAADFQRLRDGHDRYFADPFVLVHAGATHVFVEELPYATGRGVISHFTLDARGQSSQPRPVLELSHHLSYPQVFERDGALWMLPEGAASGRLDLYRAERFPDRFVHHATIAELPLHDATLFEHQERLWIAAGLKIGRGSCWDTLLFYSADRLEGPWQPHAGNPLQIDRTAARSAGATFVHDGCLWRPAQDCTAGYGGALTFNRIDRLDDESFVQTICGRLTFDPGNPHGGPHTINHAGGFELIDIYVPRG